jgi:lipoprotein-releasing system permease protein
MYKLLLCWKYLKTRFLAVICIISVMLGVATLIVVNSVMAGFSTKLKDRIHGLLSDIVIETSNYHGLPMRVETMMDRIKNSAANEHIVAIAPTIEVFGMLHFKYPSGEPVTRTVNLIGVEPKSRAAIGGFSEFLTQPERRANPSFDLTEGTRVRFEALNPMVEVRTPPQDPLLDNGLPAPDPTPETARQVKGVILGWAIANAQDKDPVTGEQVDHAFLKLGDTATLFTVGAGKDLPMPVYSPFVVCDYFQSEMAEYDSHIVFVPLDYLQTLRGMEGRCSHMQIKLKDYSKAKEVIEELKRIFPDRYAFNIATWEEKQQSIIAAIDVERSILNVLLFLIIGVAGFSILAIFSMIVVEKTKDIGILKSLGASNFGVMSIFLGYGLLLGLVGSLFGTIFGLAFTENINLIEGWLSKLTGQEVFDRSIYYFNEIPTDIRFTTVLLINIGSVGIASIFSILPAFRAAMLQPVRALRYE